MVDFVNSFEYIGIHVDNKLSMNSHVDSIHRKCTSKLAMLYKIRNFISQDTALLVSKANTLERLQDRIIRLIEYCPIKENREDINILYNSYNVEPLKVRRKRNLMKIMFDQSHDINNLHVKSCNINLRSTKKVKFKTPFTRLTKVMKSPLYIGHELWNQLPITLQTEPSKIKFKNAIKKYTFV